MKTAVTLLTLTAALALHPMSTFAQSGAVDLTFMHRTGPNSNVNAVVVQPDGKVVFGGAFTEVNFTLCNHLARADADGEVDASFDPGGGPDGVVHALALQSDGKMLIGGAFANYNGTSRTRVARLNADGSLDATFDPGTGADGLVKFVAVQTNGQVLIQGNFTNYNGTPRLGLARLNANGSLDPSFDPGSRALNLSALAWQPNGKVVFSGAFTNLDGFTSTNLARLNADGSLDTNFTALARLSNLANSVVVQRDGNILLTGLFTNVNGAPFNRIARLSSDGSLDPGFNPGTGLYIPFTFPWWFTGYPIRSVEQPDGQLLVWGAFTNYNGTPCNGAVRLNPNGSLDPSFSPLTGIFDRSAMTYSPVTSVCVLGDGQVLVPNRAMPYLRRLLANGSVDATWMSETGASGTVSAIVLQSDGMSLLVGTFAQINGVPRTGLARLHADGRLDASFNPNLGPSAGVYSIALQPDGELVVGGSFTSVNGVAQTNLARLHADGTLDATFNPTLGPNVVQTVLLQPDGRVLVTGQFATGPGTEDWTSLIRLHADGTKDAAYDVRWQDGWYDTLRQRLALQSDGKLVISGEFTSVNGVARTSLARLNSDGSLDLTFNPSLSAVPREEQYAEVHALALQPDGKLLVAGSLQFLDQG
ncbi:MAG: delta-60 repeat domain-containing protein, partial [Verrucomicrobia bacterium]|nr:delta-60 repeat domain-containing protein [Verrucomicrobiota bacterium]